MSHPVRSTAADLNTEMVSFIGRYADKTFDWDAFPANRDFPELARAQIRYIGAGGSPKVNDPDTLPAQHFTLSMVHQPSGNYAAAHSHEIEEAFLVLGGVLTIGWSYGEEVIEARLGPKDMCLNKLGRPHGFRNDGVEPMLCSIMVGSGKPRPPVYVAHPRDTDPDNARRFGAKPGKVSMLSSAPAANEHHREFNAHVVRYNQQPIVRDPAGFARKVYIGAGGAAPGSYRKDLIHLPRGLGVRAYERAVEDAFLVLEGVVTVGWEEGGQVVEQRLGPKDMIFNPAGRAHYFRNDGFDDAQFMMIVGTPEPESVAFRSA